MRAASPLLGVAFILCVVQLAVAPNSAEALMHKAIDQPFLQSSSVHPVNLYDKLDERMMECARSVAATYNTSLEPPLAPHVFLGRRQVGVED